MGGYDEGGTLHLSLWNDEHYASYASEGLAAPARSGRTATAQVTTDPAETLFRLNGADPPANRLLVGYADCSTGSADDG